MRSLTFPGLLSVLATAPFAFCQRSSTIAGPSDAGIWGIPASIYQEAISHPNATGSLEFSLSNGAEYRLQLNITADVPLTNASRAIYATEKDYFSTASVLSLVAQDENTTASFCTSLWSGLSANSTRAAQGKTSQEGAVCGGMLSPDCISDLLTEGSKDTPTCTNAPSLPNSCLDELALVNTRVGFGPTTYQGSEVVLLSSGSSPYADRGNQTAWTAVATNIWLVLLALTPEGTGANSTGASTEVSLNCMRPDTFSEESTDPNLAASTSTGGAAPTATSSPTSSPTSGAASVRQVSGASLLCSVALGLVFFG